MRCVPHAVCARERQLCIGKANDVETSCGASVAWAGNVEASFGVTGLLRQRFWSSFGYCLRLLRCRENSSLKTGELLSGIGHCQSVCCT